jgi:hypothetical protein
MQNHLSESQKEVNMVKKNNIKYNKMRVINK